MTEGEWMKKVSETRLTRRFDVEHIVELLSEVPVSLHLISIAKVGDDGSYLEWGRHFNDVQNAAGFLFDQCELFNNQITNFLYSPEVRMISITIENNIFSEKAN